jgi:hypothetical protein
MTTSQRREQRDCQPQAVCVFVPHLTPLLPPFHNDPTRPMPPVWLRQAAPVREQAERAAYQLLPQITPSVWLDRARGREERTKKERKEVNSNQINDGGPAFPCTGNPHWQHDAGMTLRDYFAAAVMTGLCASDTVLEKANQMDEDLDAVLAGMAYQAADSMIARRSKGGAQ